VLDAVRTVPRHLFVKREQRPRAYFDMALPIGDKQTISSPFIVALMTEALKPQPTDRVLEIGTGSGYQAAILSGLVAEVYSIEIVEPLGRLAKRTLAKLGYDNVRVRIGDGFAGWPEFAPFDKIIVTCSPGEVPQPLVDQLHDDGQIVVPVGDRYQQTLYLLTKHKGEIRERALRPTLFVPMTGQALDGVQNPIESLSITNGSFEEKDMSDGLISGWYYQRQLARLRDDDAPDKEFFLRFENQTPGRASHALQGFSVDGRHVSELTLSAWVRAKRVHAHENSDRAPCIAITFYDDQQRELGNQWAGPWHGDQPWQEVKTSFRVPRRAQHGILRIGLFGAVGTFDVDQIRLKTAEK